MLSVLILPPSGRAARVPEASLNVETMERERRAAGAGLALPWG